MPPFHKALFSSDQINRIVLNIGGIANITFLPVHSARVIGFDTGPGNGLLDDWCLRHLDLAYDREGQLASQGEVCSAFLQQMLTDPYFTQAAPKSTGREYFSYNWIKQQLEHFQDDIPKLDVLASLAELTAVSIALQIKQLVPVVDEVLVCGGGMHNTDLIKRLQNHLQDLKITSTEAYQLHPDWVEASAFAWLAQQTLQGQNGNLPEVTGARESVVLGGIWPGKYFFL